MRDPADNLLVIQGGYYLLTGLWPIFSLKTFEWFTGPKKEGWLVKTFGALVAAVALPLLMAGRKGEVDTNTLTLAIAVAAALALCEVVYVFKRKISPRYLIDAAAETLLVAGYAVAAFA